MAAPPPHPQPPQYATRTSQFAEHFDLLKQEYEELSREVNMYKMQKEDLERKSRF
jgi:Tup N-terminal